MGRAGHEGDFSAYTVVRWPAMLRTLVLLGCPRAAQVVQEGLARCYPRWGELRESQDPDVHVYRELLEEWHRVEEREHRTDAARTAQRRARARRTWGAPRPVLPLPAPEPDLAEARTGTASEVDVLPQLTQAVAHLAPAERAVVVLRFTAHLEDVQVADVLDLDVGEVAEQTQRGLAHLGRDRLERLVW